MGKKREVICGVYEIKNKINGLFYIGSSSNIYSRWTKHKRELRKNVHSNYYLQDDWNEFGSDAFSFTIIKRCCENDKLSME